MLHSWTIQEVVKKRVKGKIWGKGCPRSFESYPWDVEGHTHMDRTGCMSRKDLREWQSLTYGLEAYTNRRRVKQTFKLSEW